MTMPFEGNPIPESEPLPLKRIPAEDAAKSRVQKLRGRIGTPVKEEDVGRAIPFSPVPDDVAKMVAKESPDIPPLPEMTIERAQRLIKPFASIQLKVKAELGLYPDKFPDQLEEAQQYFPPPEPWNAFLFALARYIDAREFGYPDEAKRLGNHAWVLAKNLNLASDAEVQTLFSQNFLDEKGREAQPGKAAA